MLSTILKERTLDAHRELEALLITRLKSIKSSNDYVRILKWFYDFYAPLEIQILHQLPRDILPDLPSRRKSELLLNDIESATGESYEPSQLNFFPINNTFEALGALYVMEGSTLGGIIIRKMLMKILPADSDRHLTFFGGYGSETGFMWETFKNVLDTYPLDDDQRDLVINSANQTFINFKQCIN